MSKPKSPDGPSGPKRLKPEPFVATANFPPIDKVSLLKGASSEDESKNGLESSVKPRAIKINAGKEPADRGESIDEYKGITWLINQAGDAAREDVDAYIRSRWMPGEASKLSLPERPPERWSERPDKSETVPQFLERVWWSRGYRGLLTQSALRKLDGGLRSALFHHCKVTGDDPATLVPSKWKRGDAVEAVRLWRAGDKEGALEKASVFTIANYLTKEPRNE